MDKKMSLLLNEKQRMAIKKAINWYYYKQDKIIFIISGLAGTGKTSLVRILVNILGLAPYQVVYCSFTGRAVEILRRKGCQANTIHKTFYSVRKVDNKIRFSKKKNLSSAIKLIVIDELSMVNDKMMNDIISFNIPIIGLGDHAQLPPIYGANKYISNPDVFLEDIMRQKGDLGILDLAQMSRKGEYIPFGTYTESKVIHVREIEDIEKYDIILCWKNATRKNLNIIVRSKLGIESDYPTKGEKLICLKNNYVHLLEYGDIPIFLVNGMDLISLADVSFHFEDIGSCFPLIYGLSYIEGMSFKTRVHRGPFDSYKTGNNYIIPGEVDEDIVFLDYGYAYTVHKSQGSEFDHVLIIDEFKGSADMYNRWLYTAITRARKSVTIARYI
jgi:exodeoxyribonuclease-5